MTSAEGDLSLVWAVLESQTGAIEGLRVRETGVSIKAGGILAGCDAEGRRHLLIPLPERAAFAAETSIRGVRLTKRRLDTGRGIAEFLDVECRLAHLHPVFATLSLDLLRAAADSPDQPAAACRVVLDRWRELLGSERSPLLPEEALVGLLAELLVLRDVLAHDDARRLDVWTGPSGAVHDFRRGAHAVEVKGTRAREGKFVEVHGVEQLVPPAGGTLHLVWVRLEVDDASPLSVPAVLRGLREMGVDSVALARQAALVGYDPAHEEEYGRHRYRMVESRVYAVDDTFPRVVPESFRAATLPPGVLRLRYVVDLTNEPPTPLPAEGAAEVLRRLGTA